MVKLLNWELINSIQNSSFEFWRLSWWLEIKTVIPACTYYVGPFSREKEAKFSQQVLCGGFIKEESAGNYC